MKIQFAPDRLSAENNKDQQQLKQSAITTAGSTCWQLDHEGRSVEADLSSLVFEDGFATFRVRMSNIDEPANPINVCRAYYMTLWINLNRIAEYHINSIIIDTEEEEWVIENSLTTINYF